MRIEATATGAARRKTRFVSAWFPVSVVLTTDRFEKMSRDAQRIDGNPWGVTGTLPGRPLSDLLQ